MNVFAAHASFSLDTAVSIVTIGVNGWLLHTSSGTETRHHSCCAKPLYLIWENSCASICHCRGNDHTPLDRGRNRTRPPTPAQDRQRQENPISEAPRTTKGTGQIARASQTQKEEVTSRLANCQLLIANKVGQRPVLLTPNAP
jgi:hypothetical protein